MLNAALEDVGKIPLTVFGGAVTEMAPSDLPEGASPFNQDCDFLPGSVFSRGGRQSVYVFSGNFVELLGGAAISTPGQFAPNEAAWGNPGNAVRNIPGTYAAVVLNAGSGSTPAVDQALTAFDGGTVGTTLQVGPFSPEIPQEYVIATCAANSWSAFTPGGALLTGGNAFLFVASLTVNPTTYTGTHTSGTHASIAAMSVITTDGLTPTLGQVFNSSGLPASSSFVTGIPSNHSILVALSFATRFTSPTISVTDEKGNTYVQVARVDDSQETAVLFLCQNPQNAPKIVTVSTSGGTYTPNAITVAELTNLLQVSSPGVSQILQASNFGANLNTGVSITGLQVEVSGHQSVNPPDAVITAQLVTPAGVLSTKAIKAQLPLADGTIFIGSPGENWGLALTPAMLNSPQFAVNLVASTSAGETAAFDVYAVKLKIFFAPSPPANMDWVKTYEQQNGAIATLALDANGVLWQEDAINNPGVLNSITTSIAKNTFAKSVTFENVEYIALTDLLQGTDMPRRWDGSNLRRISQYGPGAPPSFVSTSVNSAIVSIVQQSPVLFPTGSHDFITLGNGPVHLGSPQTPGNVISIQPRTAFVRPANIVPGSNIVITGAPLLNGFNINNDPTGATNPPFWTVTSVGPVIQGNFTSDWITFQVPFTGFFSINNIAGVSVQGTQATMTTTAQVPFLEVGNQFTLTGCTPAGWNNTFTVQSTPNAAVLQITSTQLTNNVAQYTYVLISGTAPIVGQFINVNNTLNGNGIFNVIKAVITSVSASSFSIALVSPNIAPAAESVNASAAVYGTIFLFDPAGTVTGNPIIGNDFGTGSIATTGVMGIGTRRAVVIFLTDDGSLTAPSPYTQFNITGATSAIVGTNIAVGPPNVVARILAFTGANGGNYFWIPTPVTVITNGQSVTYSATIINDNSTTQATFSFPDNVLLNATAIDIQGNNLFAQIELGSCRGLLTYASRLIAWGVQTKVTGFLNLSFDGGTGVQTSGGTVAQLYPLGWTVDPVNGGGSQIITSALFGNSFYIQNTTGITQGVYGMITQPAYVNQLGTPILTAATLYSCRLAARCPSGVQTGQLVVDLFSATLNAVFGSFTIPLSSMSSNFQIFSGTLLTSPMTKVPPDLVLRVYATNLPNLGDVELDRVEPFPTLQPTYATSFFASYANNQEAFDVNTGFFGPNQNQQKANGGAVLFDRLYMLKETSTYSTSDNGLTEPFKWSWKEESPKAGTIGIHSYDYGDNWLLTASRAGVYFFEGGEFIKVSQEIQSVWELINWKFGHTIVLRNNPDAKTFDIAIPIPTPNKYMPEIPANANPTTPNVVLRCSYRELNTGAALAQTGPIRSTFQGRLMSPEPARKWSFWNLATPYMDLIDRGNNSKVLFYCSGYANTKIYQLTPGVDDDGTAINAFYLTHGMPKPEIAEQRGVDVLRSQFDFLILNVSGAGTMNLSVYQEDPTNQPSIPLDPLTLDVTTQGNNEVGVWMKGNRYFLRVGTNALGANWSLSTVIAIMSPDPWAPIRSTTRASLT